MEKKRYTAAEMREAYEGLLTPSASLFHIGGGKTRTYDYSDIQNILRQAADTEERLQKEYKAIMKNIEEWPNHGDETVFAHQLPWMLERILGVEAP